MKKKGMSIAVKLNILLTAMVLVVSLVLVMITYKTYTKTVYAPFYDNLESADSVFSEEGTEILNNTTLLYRLACMDGYMEAYTESEKQDADAPVQEWLSQYIILDAGGKSEIWTRDEVNEKFGSEDGESTDPFDASYVYLLYGYAVLGIAEKAGISRVRILAENEDGGYIHILEMYSSYDAYSRWQIRDFGGRFEEVGEISEYLSRKSRRPFLSEYQGRTELVRVSPVENDGVTIWMIYACDVTESRQGQRSYLLQCLLLIGLMVFAAIVISLLILRQMAVRPLRQLAKAAARFASGDGAASREDVVQLNISRDDEIGYLYHEIQSMQTRIIDNTEHLTQMTAERERIGTELSLASRIQENMLPGVFPAFPGRTEFDIYASMTPAKEVGGDFYDFFLVDEDHLALMIADVSGKGVPAALFMMATKILADVHTMSGLSPARVLETMNHQICSSNREEMFVTLWLGILEISTGKLTAANAGHEFPALALPGEDFRLYKDPHSFVVGGMDEMKYREYVLEMKPGARLFVYTDGLPEANDADGRQYGTDRMLSALNSAGNGTPEQILSHVTASVTGFTGDAEQFDDLTMLCLEYRGNGGNGKGEA